MYAEKTTVAAAKASRKRSTRTLLDLKNIVDEYCDELLAFVLELREVKDPILRFDGVQALCKKVGKFLETIESWDNDEDVDKTFYAVEVVDQTVFGLTFPHRLTDQRLSDHLFSLTLKSFMSRVTHIKSEFIEEHIQHMFMEVTLLRTMVERLKEDLTDKSNEVASLQRQLKDFASELRAEAKAESAKLEERLKAEAKAESAKQEERLKAEAAKQEERLKAEAKAESAKQEERLKAEAKAEAAKQEERLKAEAKAESAKQEERLKAEAAKQEERLKAEAKAESAKQEERLKAEAKAEQEERLKAEAAKQEERLKTEAKAESAKQEERLKAEAKAESAKQEERLKAEAKAESAKQEERLKAEAKAEAAKQEERLKAEAKAESAKQEERLKAEAAKQEERLKAETDAIRSELDRMRRSFALGQAARDAEAALLHRMGGDWADGDYIPDPNDDGMSYFVPSRKARELHKAFQANSLSQDVKQNYTEFLSTVFNEKNLSPGRALRLSEWYTMGIRSAKLNRNGPAHPRVESDVLRRFIQTEKYKYTWNAIINAALQVPKRPVDDEIF